VLELLHSEKRVAAFFCNQATQIFAQLAQTLLAESGSSSWSNCFDEDGPQAVMLTLLRRTSDAVVL
jgi:hypothetical protein